ncbi:uncharacterized protein P174DRAFT_516267 [Aspergillus novofumigatus IBT 16806]|uniref:Uncharacterized protein n=1 Tax=Aspergillus novofumigatus (strain IBT 16806) TaxID=1392255 RepID=A0A2I1BUR2_ASPN1|nr:uncharacterized protein P174DRAFT_516267 [Aspergillus novofumigatus IBT 16806]PKX89106.1 hypothetical protein P174DRAFT_516267 [Aspergillus novofumigatus IBT 16806]
MTTTLQNSPWVLKKSILVYAPNLNVSCCARLCIIHDQTANQGSISLLITADLANLSGRLQVLTLNIPPDRVGKYALARKSNDNLCPSHLLSLLPAPVNNVLDVLTLSLSLSMTGIVLCLPEIESLSPATPGHTVSFNHARHGVVQKDWRSLSEQAKEADPPLYCEESVSEQGIGKWRRGIFSSYYPWLMSPNNERQKRLLLPSPQLIGSPTEVNMLSTLSLSPSLIRPTYFTHASSPGHIECKRLTRLKHELRGRQHLLAMPKDIDCDIEKISFAEIETIERRLERYVDEMVERRLKSHILDEIVDSAVSECHDQIYAECKTNEAEFREQVDDGNSEVRNTANKSQQYMKDIEDQGIEVEMSAEAKVVKFKQWFNASAQSLLSSKSSSSYKLGANARRSSI